MVRAATNHKTCQEKTKKQTQFHATSKTISPRRVNPLSLKLEGNAPVLLLKAGFRGDRRGLLALPFGFPVNAMNGIGQRNDFFARVFTHQANLDPVFVSQILAVETQE